MIIAICDKCKTELRACCGATEVKCSCGATVAISNAVGMGTRLSRGLERIGVTKERFSAAMGRPCNCPERERAMDNFTFKIKRLNKRVEKDGRVYQSAHFVRQSAMVEAAMHELLPKVLALNPTSIIGVARSGLIPATVLACQLNIPLFTVSQHRPTEIHFAGLGTRSLMLESDLGERPLIIDDTVHSGRSMKRFSKYLRAAVYIKPGTERFVDAFAEYLDTPHILEWNIFNSPYITRCGVDMDGVLCKDCPDIVDDDSTRYRDWLSIVDVRYPAQYSTILAIISARMEKYRDITVEWLERHKVRYQHLILCPATTLAERAQMNIAVWKAEWADRLGCDIFIESDKRLATAMDAICRRCTPIAI